MYSVNAQPEDTHAQFRGVGVGLRGIAERMPMKAYSQRGRGAKYQLTQYRHARSTGKPPAAGYPNHEVATYWKRVAGQAARPLRGSQFPLSRITNAGSRAAEHGAVTRMFRRR